MVMPLMPLEPEPLIVPHKKANVLWQPHGLNVSSYLERVALEQSTKALMDDYRGYVLSGIDALLRFRFCNIDHNYGRKTEIKLHTFHGWDHSPNDGQWDQISDIEYVGLDSSRIHTLVQYGKGEQSGQIFSKHVQKRYMCDHELTMGLRGYVITEDEVDKSVIPLVVSSTSTSVRVKQRKIFVTGHWAYVLTRWWTGSTLLEAESKQRTDSPQWDLRLEFWRQNSVAETLMRDASERLYILLRD